jgi:hypothetical protein
MTRVLFDTDVVLDVLPDRSRQMGNAKATRILSSILKVFRIAPVDEAVLQEALHAGLSDFGDAVTSAAAHRTGCEFIVTRDPKGFRGSAVQSFTPEELRPLLTLST